MVFLGIRSHDVTYGLHHPAAHFHDGAGAGKGLRPVCAVSEGVCGKLTGATGQPRCVGGSIVSPVSFCRSSLCVFECVIGIILGLHLMGTN